MTLTLCAALLAAYDRLAVAYLTRAAIDGRPEMRTEQVRHVRWSPVSGRVARAFDDVLIYAARSLRPAHVDGLWPWNLSELTDYRPDYLAGLAADAGLPTVATTAAHYATPERFALATARAAVRARRSLDDVGDGPGLGDGAGPTDPEPAVLTY